MNTLTAWIKEKPIMAGAIALGAVAGLLALSRRKPSYVTIPVQTQNPLPQQGAPQDGPVDLSPVAESVASLRAAMASLASDQATNSARVLAGFGEMQANTLVNLDARNAAMLDKITDNGNRNLAVLSDLSRQTLAQGTAQTGALAALTAALGAFNARPAGVTETGTQTSSVLTNPPISTVAPSVSAQYPWVKDVSQLVTVGGKTYWKQPSGGLQFTDLATNKAVSTGAGTLEEQIARIGKVLGK